ncbi:MAG: type II toxin-antitoxin system HicB family antitoxin [Clostridia bacterium]|nr:type II toxin-antitoxin system HicB family antitoxin [Clostridia bacterium]
MALHVFPAVFEPEGELYNVSFPDIPNCYTCGNDLADAMHMAEDALCGWLSRAEEKKAEIPSASEIGALQLPSGCFASLILADTDAYRRAHSSKAVKKTLTIPSWLNDAAEARGVNFSQILQDALRQNLGF